MVNDYDEIRHEQRTVRVKMDIPEADQKKNFLVYYKQFINIDKMNMDRNQYINLINSMNRVIPKDVFSKNTLILCDNDVAKEVFLVAFTKHEKLLTYRYMALSDTDDFWMGNLQYKNMNLSDDETLYANRDIKEDVFCIYASKHMLEASKASNRLSTIMSERMELRGKVLSKRISIVYFQGTREDLNDPRFYGIRNFFSSKLNGRILNFNK